MTDIITILPDSVANQIAAGEVVDRPASAVKELLENAVDAGATHIQLIVKDAGRTLIQVIDNGCGMSDSDARLCFERHATSKIKQSDDLFNLHTMGFRGEALASIAAIAQVELKTRLHDNEIGTFVINEGCQIKSQTAEACPAGTSIAVKNLFFNVPARRNFLKKDTIELSHIEEVFRRITLTNCDRTFLFYSNGKLLYDLRPGNLMQRLCQLYGNAYRERFYPVDEDSDIVTMKGYVGKPEFARRTRGEQYIFVNNRFIKHPALSAAIEKAYTDLLPDRYYPSYFINLTVNPSRIDVNIHPTKTEVKFIDEHSIFALLRAAAKKALGQFDLATRIEFNPSSEIDFTPAPKGYVPQQPGVSFDPTYNPFDPPQSKVNEPPLDGGYKGSYDTPAPMRPSGSFGTYRQPSDTNDPPSHRWDNFFDSETTSSSEAESPTPARRPAMGAQCLQIQNRWIATTLNGGLLLIDQQRAHERVIYERLINNNSSSGAQQLLFPVNCTFSAADADLFGELLPDLTQRGFVIDNLGKNTFVVSATPQGIDTKDMQQIFDQMISDHKGSMLQKHASRDQSLCRSLAHQMAIRPGQALQQDEMQTLIADLFSCTIPDLSPSGQKTLVILNPDQLQKLL
ncbi:MAG: DNA mismatch repair endonuclease MutL [Bacteroidales bacterium]|nr:DNA mismatch repair endonuclease MutL [Bacteroidales bacterium]